VVSKYCNKELISSAFSMACSIFMIKGFFYISSAEHFIFNNIKYSSGTPGYEQSVIYMRLIFSALACISFGVSIYFGIIGVKKIKRKMNSQEFRGHHT